MTGSYYCLVEADGEGDTLSQFYYSLLLTGGDLRQLRSAEPNEGLYDFDLFLPSQDPVQVSFECDGPLPETLMRNVSEVFPTLVFALLFIDYRSCRNGFKVYRGGRDAVDWRINEDILRVDGLDRDGLVAQALHPEAATIDGHEAVAWASRLHEALNVVSQETAITVRLEDEWLELQNFADTVEKLGPEYEHATTPLGDRRRYLTDLCRKASCHETRVACRMAVRRVLEADRSRVERPEDWQGREMHGEH